MIRWLLLGAFVLAACSPAGRPCARRHECGGGFLCDFPNEGGCGVQGHCRPAAEVSRRGGEGTGIDCDDATASGVSVCTCEDVDTSAIALCYEEPAFFRNHPCARACELTVLTQAVHGGARSPSEYCRGSAAAFPGLATVVQVPSRCCDCSLAGAAPDGCFNAATGEAMPTGCCECVTPATPDPTGRCVPPGGVFPAGASSWCCPIAADAGVADAGP